MAYRYQTSQKPEDVLRRAEEYVSVGKKDSALKVIFDLLSNRRGRTWSQAHEKVMIRYLELCTEVKNSRYAKEGLHQFRNISLTQAPSSLEKVIEHFLTTTKKLTANAAAECNSRTVTREIEDLENDVSPEAILLEVVTADKTRDRTEREILVPWLKFLWESFRIVLDLLRNQIRLEALYHSIAKDAFKFCEKYSRTTEFRRLSDLLRGHLNPKYQRPDQEISNTPESMAAHLETRFEQLRVASKLRLWNEGFRTIEDIHAIMNQPGLKFSSRLLGNYYEKLTHLFLVSRSYLFHAYAYEKFFILTRDKKKSINKEALSKLASKVLLAAMSIPLRSSKAGKTLSEEAIQSDKNDRMAVLLGFDIDPKRSALLRELESEAVIEVAEPVVQQLYQVLESSEAQSATEFVEKVSPLLKHIFEEEEFEKYVQPLKALSVIRLVSILSNDTKMLSLDTFAEYMDKMSISMQEAETAVVKCVQERQVNNLRVSIDHGKNVMHFGQDFLESKESRLLLKRLINDLRGELVSLDSDIENASAKRMKLLSERVKTESEKDHKAMLARRTFAEERKSNMIGKEKERKERIQTQFIEKQQEASFKEKQRLAMELERKQKEQEEKKKNAEDLDKLREFLKNSGETIDEEALLQLSSEEQLDLVEKTKQKLILRAKEEANKRVRACQRLEALAYAKKEIQAPKRRSLIRTLVQKTQKKETERWKQHVADSKKRHDRLLADKKRFASISAKIEASVEPFIKKWEKNLVSERQKRRVLVQKQQCLQKYEDAKKQLQAAKDAKKREEEERRRLEELEKERQESAAVREEAFSARQNDNDEEPEQRNWRQNPIAKPAMPERRNEEKYQPRNPAPIAAGSGDNPWSRRPPPQMRQPIQQNSNENPQTQENSSSAYSYRPSAAPTSQPWARNTSRPVQPSLSRREPEHQQSSNDNTQRQENSSSAYSYRPSAAPTSQPWARNTSRPVQPSLSRREPEHQQSSNGNSERQESSYRSTGAPTKAWQRNTSRPVQPPLASREPDNQPPQTSEQPKPNVWRKGPMANTAPDEEKSNKSSMPKRAWIKK